MSRRRALAGLLGGVAVAVSGWGLSVAPAEAVSSYIQVQYAPDGVSPTTNVGLVSVTVAATSPLTSMDVKIYRGDGTEMLDLTLSDFVQPASDGNGQFGTWTVKTPITTSKLNLGSYSVYLSAADQGGDQVTSFVGDLAFLNVVQYPWFTASGTSFNYDNQDVTLSGTAMLLAPDGSTAPFAGKTLSLGDPAPAGVSVVTGADGSFRLTMQVTQSGAYSLSYAGDATTQSNSTNPVQLTFTTLPVHIVATLKAPQVNAGAPDSVSGTVSYADGGVSRPLAGNTVSLYPGAIASGEKPTATAVTSSSGTFTMPVPTTDSTHWTLITTATVYFPQAYVIVPMTVAQPTTITGFDATLSPFAVVHVSATCITAGRGKVRIQYAAKPGGPWHTLGTLGLFSTRGCHAYGGRGTRFTGHFTAKLAAAYYRAVLIPTPDWQGSVSKAIYLHRLLTKITNFTITPHTVQAHGQITVSGRLWARGASGTWRAYGRRTVIVVFRYHRAWYRYRYEPVTSATGWFKHTFSVNASSPFFAQYNGDSAHFACASAHINIMMSGAAPAALAQRAPALPIVPEPRRPFGPLAAIAAGQARRSGGATRPG